jgi:hypothetical protein
MTENSSLPSTSSLVIIGAGPIGLETAALAASREVDFVVLEQGAIGGNIRKWGHLRLFSPFWMNRSRLGLKHISDSNPNYIPPNRNHYLTGDEFVTSYLEPLGRAKPLSHRIFTGQQVEGIGRDQISKRDLIGDPRRSRYPFRLLVRSSAGQSIHLTRSIVDASGVYSTPRTIGNGGIPALGEAKALEDVPERIHFGVVDLLSMKRLLRKKSILLVGSGHSAATQISEIDSLALQLDLKVTWIWRRPDKQPYIRIPDDTLPDRDRQSALGNRLASAPPHWLTCLPGSTVESITVKKSGRLGIDLQQKGLMKNLTVDHILACVGFRPDAKIYRQLQVHECYATEGPIKISAALLESSALDCLDQEEQGIDTLRNPEPHFYIVGNKSYGTGNNFLLSDGINQAKTVMTELVPHLKSLPI